MPKKVVVYYDDPLPREITEIIVRITCFSFRGLLVVARVCHWWQQIANDVHITKIRELFSFLLPESYDGKVNRSELSRLLMWTSYRPRKSSLRLGRQRDKYMYQLLRDSANIDFLNDMFLEEGVYYFTLGDGKTVSLRFEKKKKYMFYIDSCGEYDCDVEEITGISVNKFMKLCGKFDYLSGKVIDLGNIYLV